MIAMKMKFIPMETRLKILQLLCFEVCPKMYIRLQKIACKISDGLNIKLKSPCSLPKLCIMHYFKSKPLNHHHNPSYILITCLNKSLKPKLKSHLP